MKELEYPFDAEYIIKKRKSIKRTLLADGSKRLKKKIAVFGGSTTNDIVVYLELFLLNQGIEAEFYESEYNKFYEDAMFDNEELKKFKPSLEIEDAEDIIYKQDLDDMSDVIVKLLKEASQEADTAKRVR